jgi:hypothetical protein
VIGWFVFKMVKILKYLNKVLFTSLRIKKTVKIKMTLKRNELTPHEKT